MKKLLFIILFLPVMAQAQIITTIAGNGTSGYSGDNGPATAAEIYYPTGVAVDNANNVYIADNEDHCIRKVAPSGIITTIAGNGTLGCSGYNGAATNSILGYPYDIAVDGKGNIFIADAGCTRVFKIDTSGMITSIAGNGTLGYSGDGGAATDAVLSYPQGVTVDTAGNVFIADATNYVVRKINTSGIITTIAGNGISGFSGDGGPATAAQLSTPYDVAIDGIGNIFIADASNNRIRKVSINGIITTIAGQDTLGYSGDDGPATIAKLREPSGIKVDSNGNIYFADSYNGCIRKVNTSGIITTIAGPGTSGHLGDGGNPTLANLSLPYNIALDAIGNIYIADAGNNRIRLISYDLAVPYLNTITHDVNIWPNPANGTLNIISSAKITAIIISNVLGQTVYSHNYTTTQVQVNVLALPQGIYFIKINGTVVKRFVKD